MHYSYERSRELRDGVANAAGYADYLVISLNNLRGFCATHGKPELADDFAHLASLADTVAEGLEYILDYGQYKVSNAK